MLMTKPLQFYRTPSLIIKIKPSYHTRIPRSRGSQTLSPESPQKPLRWPPRQPTLSGTIATSCITSSIQDKWVINLSKKELTLKEKYLLQKGPTFAVTLEPIHVKEYISTTTVAALQAGEFNGVDCCDLYHDLNRILNTDTNKPIHRNITKAEHLALKISGKTRTALLLLLIKVYPGCNRQNRMHHKI